MKVFSLEMHDPYEGVRYLAYGLDGNNMPMYRITEEGLSRTGARFPAALKFMSLEMDSADPDLVEEETVTARYGRVITR